MHDDGPLLGSDEAIDLLDRLGVPIHRATLLRWVAKGTVTAIHKNPGPSGAYLFTRAEIMRLARDRVAAQAGAA